MRKKSWGEYKKSWLDKLIEKVRLSLISENFKNKIVLDLGCGFDASFLRSIRNDAKSCVGVDLTINKKYKDSKVSLISSRVDNKLPLKTNSFDIITSMAVIEHVHHPDTMLSEAHRLLKSGSVLLLTTPSSYSKPLLEFLAFKIHLISEEEIGDHKRYYTKRTLKEELVKAGFKENKISVRSFFGLNLYCKATK